MDALYSFETKFRLWTQEIYSPEDRHVLAVLQVQYTLVWEPAVPPETSLNIQECSSVLSPSRGVPCAKICSLDSDAQQASLH
jgi:hypothetical protein